MKTKKTVTNYLTNFRAFGQKMYQFRGTGRQFAGSWVEIAQTMRKLKAKADPNQLIAFAPNHASTEHRLLLNDPMIRWPDDPIIRPLSRCIRKIKRLAVRRQIPPKFHVIVKNGVTPFVVRQRQKTRGEKVKDSLAMLLKTNGGKMSVFLSRRCSLAMLMKSNGVNKDERLPLTSMSRPRVIGAGGYFCSICYYFFSIWAAARESNSVQEDFTLSGRRGNMATATIGQ